MKNPMFMFRLIFLTAAVLCFAEGPLFAAPALVTTPEWGDPFTMTVEPRNTPEALGTRTRDGYLVFPSRSGEGVIFIEPRGDRIPVPLWTPKGVVPDIVTGPAGEEVPLLQIHGGHPELAPLEGQNDGKRNYLK
ncbi:MAG: hypothetical protein LBR61_02145 [Synergistaceae bacterium]|jgi:hypothetical protein|nr:hypothetical protein [Synergistaceae bacterium]